MAARLLSRSRTQTLALSRILHRPSIDPLPTSASQSLRSLHSFLLSSQPPLAPPDHGRSRPDLPFASPGKIWGYEQSFSRLYCAKAQEVIMTNQVEKSSSPVYDSAGKQSMSKTVGRTLSEGREDDSLKVTCFSPLEATLTKKRSSGLSIESLKIKRYELSQKITYALIPALLLVSKTPLTTSLLIFSVYWQIYGFFKEIFLDYVHQEVTQKWVLIYFKLLLFILVKDTILAFGLV